MHPSAGPRCRVCGESQVTVALESLVSVRQRRRWQRRTPTTRGWRWFDGLFVAALVLGPLEAERHDPRWFLAALLVVAAGWALVRVTVHFVRRYRLVVTAGPPVVSAVAYPPRGPSSGDAVRGMARRLRGNVDAHLLSRRCLATSLTLEPRAKPGAVRLRQARAAAFVVEHGDGQQLVVEGQLVLTGEVAATSASDDEARASFGGAALEAIWLEGAVAREVLLQNRNRVEVSGGLRREATVEGVASNPVRVTVG